MPKNVLLQSLKIFSARVLNFWALTFFSYKNV